jgi:two-component system chemotaxis response regulator CheB
MALPPQQPVSSATADRPVRVLVIADPGFIGERVCAIVAANPALELAGQVTDGISAVSFLRRSAADGVVIDIGHPEAQVKVTLSRMFRLDPDIKVVMVGSLNFANVKTSMMGLMEGAAEFVPAASRHTGRTDRQFADELAEVLKAFGRREREIIPPAPPARGRLDAPDAPAPKTVYTSKATPALSLRPPSRRIPEILAIGSSTGGPHALFTVLAMLATNVRLPILITQHMPSKFTTILAQHIDRHTGIPCSEGQHGDKLAAGRVYVAPSDHHMTVAMSSTGPEIRLDRSDAGEPGQDLRTRPAHRDPDRHGKGRPRRRQGCRRSRRYRHRPGRGDQRGLGHAGRGSDGRYLLGRAAARRDRAIRLPCLQIRLVTTAVSPRCLIIAFVACLAKAWR